MTWLLLTLLACGDDTRSDSGATTDSGTDTATTAPAETGFTWDGAWYPLGEGAMFCQNIGGKYTFSGGALREGAKDGAQANAYVYFTEEPAPGEYPVVALAALADATQAATGVADFQNGSELWYSDGDSGTVTVSQVDGALEVVFDRSRVMLNGGTTKADFDGGRMVCTP